MQKLRFNGGWIDTGEFMEVADEVHLIEIATLMRNLYPTEVRLLLLHNPGM